LPFAISTLGYSTALASDPDYSPYATHRQPKPFPTPPCVVWKELVSDDGAVTETVFGRADDAKRSETHLRVVEKPDGTMTVEVLRSDGSTLVPPKVAAEGRRWGVESADFNADGVHDFILEGHLGGVGLGAWNRTITFVISDKDSFKVTSIFSMYFKDLDVIDTNGDGKCEFIHADLLSSAEHDEEDGRTHNYWVYHKLEIKDGRMVVAAPDRMFPKWVWYSFKPNRKSTTRISASAKERIWRAAGGDAQIFWKPDLSDNDRGSTAPAAATQPGSSSK